MKIVQQSMGIGLVFAWVACAEHPTLEGVAQTGEALSLSSFPGTPSNLSKTLTGSLLGGASGATDDDHDALSDDQENALADQFRPYIFFDSNETARTPNE